ncbi:MAG TPA: M23 family metallopeptidase [Caulobacterales bacterium]|nr:M23 family metallopeptidase [Caulobacterales bacterium]
MSVLLRLLVLVVIGVGGWLVGSLYPAPPEVLARINPSALQERARAQLQNVDLERLRGLISEDQYNRLSGEVSRVAAAAGRLITVEHETDADSVEAEMTPISMPAAGGGATPPRPGTPASSGAAATRAFESALSLCPRMTITNSPPNDGAGHVAHFSPVVNVQGVQLAVNPTHGACLSSGFGARSGRLHKGVDYHNEAGGPISAAADGTIVEMKYRDDYGNMLLIDHGHGVYTRYAHLSAFQQGLAVGAQVHAGDQIGLMGNTAGYPIPIHLHYELLLGDYNNPKGSFGLTPHSPFEYRPG